MLPVYLTATWVSKTTWNQRPRAIIFICMTDLSGIHLETIHTLLHPTFQLAVRDDIIRKNPTDGVMAELKKNLGMKTGVRYALTIPQQRAFMEYIATHPIYFHWWSIFTIFLETGCRIGEVLGLRWEDIDYEKRIISINHNLTYYPVGEDRASENNISTDQPALPTYTTSAFSYLIYGWIIEWVRRGMKETSNELISVFESCQTK